MKLSHLLNKDVANGHQYDTEITGVEMIIPSTERKTKVCNINDITEGSGTELMDRANAVVEQLGRQIMGLMVTGDRKTITSENGMTMGLSMVDGFDLAGLWHCGLCTYYFPFVLKVLEDAQKLSVLCVRNGPR